MGIAPSRAFPCPMILSQCDPMEERLLPGSACRSCSGCSECHSCKAISTEGVSCRPPIGSGPLSSHLRDTGGDFPLTPVQLSQGIAALPESRLFGETKTTFFRNEEKIAASAKISQALSPPVHIYLE